MNDDEEDLYGLALGEQFSAKKEPVQPVHKPKESETTQPDYASLFRQLLAGSRAQIGQLKEENEKLKVNLQNAIKSGGVVVCPNCTHHFNDRLCLLRPRTMKKMRARNCVELEFSTEDDLEAWLHLNQLETNNDGLPTIFKVAKNQEVKNNSLDNVGSLLPKLVGDSNFRIPKKRTAEKEERMVEAKKKRRSEETPREKKVIDHTRNQNQAEKQQPQKSEIPKNTRKEEPKKREEVRIPLKNRVTMPGKSDKAETPAAKPALKPERAPIVWNDAPPVQSSSSTSSTQFSFKISERTVKKEKTTPPKVAEVKKVEPMKEKFKFVPTSMKKDPRETQSTSTAPEAASKSCGSSSSSKKESGTPATSSSKTLKPVVSKDIDSKDTRRNNEKMSNAMSSNSSENSKPDKYLKRSNSKMASVPSAVQKPLEKRRSQSPVTRHGNVPLKKACAISSAPNVTHQQPSEKKSMDPKRKSESPHSMSVSTSSAPNVTNQNPIKVSSFKPSSRCLKAKESIGALKESTPNAALQHQKPEEIPVRRAIATISTSSIRENAIQNQRVTKSPAIISHDAPQNPCQKAEQKSDMTVSPPMTSRVNLKDPGHHLLSKNATSSPDVHHFTAPAPPISWNQIAVKKTAEVLKHQQQHSERRRVEGRRHVETMIVVEQRIRKPQSVSLENLGVSKEGLEILKRLKQKVPEEQEQKEVAPMLKADDSSTSGTASTPCDNLDEDDLMKEFFPDIYNNAKKLKRHNSEFETDDSETASVFADREELELLDLVRVESVIPPSAENVYEQQNDEVEENDDFCLEDVEMTVTDEMRERILSENASEDIHYETEEPVVREESKMLMMNLNFRLSDDEDAISPATSTPKPEVLKDDEEMDFTMRMREDSFQDELDWNYGSEEDAAVNSEVDLEDGELSDGELHEEPRRRSTEENRPAEQKTSPKKSMGTLFKRRN